MAKCLVAPSVLAADFGNLQSEIEKINTSEADFFHIDIMDGVFVPNISFGFPVIKAVQQHARKDLDVHLMIVNPEKYLDTVASYGARNITVHYEACTHLHRTVHQIQQLGCRAGVALNPHTPVSVLEDILEDLDLVLIMSVNPGFGGQQFINQTFNKIKKLVSMKTAEKELLIEIDGGVSVNNAAELVACGANLLVAGSEVFKSSDPVHTIKLLKDV